MFRWECHRWLRALWDPRWPSLVSIFENTANTNHANTLWPSQPSQQNIRENTGAPQVRWGLGIVSFQILILQVWILQILILQIVSMQILKLDNRNTGDPGLSDGSCEVTRGHWSLWACDKPGKGSHGQKRSWDSSHFGCGGHLQPIFVRELLWKLKCLGSWINMKVVGWDGAWQHKREEGYKRRQSDRSDAETSEEEESPLLDLETQPGLSLA